MVTFFALLLGLVTGSAAAPEPTAPQAAPQQPSVTVTINILPAPPPPNAGAELRDPFAGPIHRVALAVADNLAAQDLQDPFDAAHLAVRAPASSTASLQSPFSNKRAAARRPAQQPTTNPLLRDPFAT